MISKTISQFRAENGIYIKDLAGKIGVELSVLEKMDTSQNPDREVINKIVEAYKLPDTYFTYVQAVTIQNIEPQKPKKPIEFFFGQALLWLLILIVITSLLAMPSGMLTGLAATMTILDDNIISNIIVILNFVISMVALLISIFSASKLTDRIITKTGYGNEIKKYDNVLYYVAIEATTVLSIINILASTVISNMSEKYEFNFLGSSIALGFIISAIAFVVETVVLVIRAFVVAHILNSTITENTAKADKTIKIISISAIISNVSYYIFLVGYRAIDSGTFDYSGTINGIIYTVVIAIVAYGMIKGQKKNEKLWLKTIPLISIIGVSSIGCIEEIIKAIISMIQN